MPSCHRCLRVQSSAELRRTSLGYLCKDNGPGTRCFVLARGLRERASKRQAVQGTAGARSESDLAEATG